MTTRTDRGTEFQAPHFNLDQLRTLQAEQCELEATLIAMRRECRTLTGRADHLRTALARGEAERAVSAPSGDAVALVDASGRDASAYFAQLQLRERELTATHNEHAAMRVELERRAAMLHDERAILAEHTTLLMHARRERFQAEAGIVQELERLALQLIEREELQANADAVRLDRARTLWTLHNQLEARQTQVAIQEQSVRHAAERFQAETEPQRQLLAERERSLTAVGGEWAALRREELRRDRERTEHRDADTARHRLALADVDALQSGVLTDAASIAAEAHALEQLRRDLDPAALRKLNDVKAKWERRLGKVKLELDRRRESLDGLTAAAEDSLRRAAAAESEALARDAERRADRQQEPLERAGKLHAIDARLLEIEAELRRGAEAKRDAALMHGELNRLTAMLESLPPPALDEGEFGEALVPLKRAG